VMGVGALAVAVALMLIAVPVQPVMVRSCSMTAADLQCVPTNTRYNSPKAWPRLQCNATSLMCTCSHQTSEHNSCEQRQVTVEEDSYVCTTKALDPWLLLHVMSAGPDTSTKLSLLLITSGVSAVKEPDSVT
jgi:hypothetical protein